MKVSILMITYNHEKFIAQAVESVLMQKANFEYELVIGEDCSTDNTRQILLEYQKKHPDKIRLLLPEKNLGMYKNAVNTLQACRGQYIAHLEGDDYWTADDKLQKQVDLLDNHPEYTMSFHNVFCFREDNQSPPGILNYEKLVYTIEDLLISNFISTPSVMYRAGVVKEMPIWFEELSMGDWPFHILHAQYGKIGYVDEVMAAYRIHAGGSWSNKSRDWQIQQIIQMLNTIKFYLHVKYEALIDRVLKFNLQQFMRLSGYEQTLNDLTIDLQNNLGLRQINLIIFPDWTQPEDLLYQDLLNIINQLLTHSEKHRITLLIDTSNIDEEEADLYLSSLLMNLMLEGTELQESEDFNISLTGKLSEIQWKILFTIIKGRINLHKEDINSISSSGFKSIPAYSIDNIHSALERYII